MKCPKVSKGFNGLGPVITFPIKERTISEPASAVVWFEKSMWVRNERTCLKPSDDIPNEEKNQYWIANG